MSRVAKLNDYWKFTPDVADFTNCKADLLLNRLLGLYTVKDKRVEMVHLFQISEAAKKHNYSIDFDKLIFDAIQEIPKDCWDKIKQELSYSVRR